MKKLKDCAEKISRLGERLEDEMARLWPYGSRVQFEIRSGQKNWTTGTVIGYSGAYQTVIVRLDKEKSHHGRIRRGEHSEKRVHWRFMR